MKSQAYLLIQDPFHSFRALDDDPIAPSNTYIENFSELRVFVEGELGRF